MNKDDIQEVVDGGGVFCGYRIIGHVDKKEFAKVLKERMLEDGFVEREASVPIKYIEHYWRVDNYDPSFCGGGVRYVLAEDDEDAYPTTEYLI